MQSGDFYDSRDVLLMKYEPVLVQRFKVLIYLHVISV